MQENKQSIYDILGDDGFKRLTAAFYRHVVTDAVLSSLYPKHDLAGAEDRLRLFLVQYFGGPATYSAQRGHPRLRLRHQPFVIGTAERNSWVTAMLAAIKEAEIPEPAAIVLRDYFENAATFLMNVSEP